VNNRDRPPIVEVYDALSALNPSWRVDVGRPSGPGWIAGSDLRTASAGPFNELLARIGERARTADRRTIAASFALRYGWASAMAIAPFLKYDCVPDLSLENVSLKFRESTFFERTAIHEARGAVAADDPRATHPSITPVSDWHELLRALRSTLTAQAIPVVEALHEWSGFARRGTWGMLTSSWAAQFTSLQGEGGDQRVVLPTIQEFFDGHDVVAIMQPRLHAVTCGDVTHLYQRRASCCRWYLLPQGELCASCPLVSQEDRLARNRAWMQKQLDGSHERRGHS
jgi:ferric iron reductase protein FhuF